MFNRKRTASVAFVVFINIYFTCQITRIVAADLKTVSMIYFFFTNDFALLY